MVRIFQLGGEYQGALVYGRRDGVLDPQVDLPSNVEARFSRALEAAGLQNYVPQLNQFCHPAYKASCENF